MRRTVRAGSLGPMVLVTPSVQTTFLFADLAGYTALTEAHGDERAADVAAEFQRTVQAALDEHLADAVKSMGDAVMVVAHEPYCALAIAQRLIEGARGRGGALGVRVGMHTGVAVERGGDWFGAAVNLAARVGAAAGAGEALMTAATRNSAGRALEGFDVRPRGWRSFKNVGEPVELFILMPAPDGQAVGLVVDPVCRMAVSPSAPSIVRRHEGAEYRFCSPACADRFALAPDRYSRAAGSGFREDGGDAERPKVVE